jgi:sporulation protein YlmC with PRC-barrel domain
MLAVPTAAQYSQPQTPQQNSQAPAQQQGQPAQQGAQDQPRTGAATNQLEFYTPQATDIRASALIGMRVHNVSDEDVGEIDDLILDDGKNLKAVVVGVGGFFGVGERSVAVEPGSVTIQRQPDGSERALIYATEENLNSAPDINEQRQAQVR